MAFRLWAMPCSLLDGASPSPLTQRRQFRPRAAHEDVRDLEGAPARGERRRDVRIARELVWGLTGVPVEDLKVPGAAGVADLSRDEVEDVARGRLARKRREQPGALDRRSSAGRVDDVEDNVPLSEL